jgi:hypothetical protein
MKDFLAFRRMITPIIIQIIFWIGAIGIFIGGIVVIATADDGGAGQIVGGIVLMILGPLAVRIWCEILILFFRMNETITEIKNNTKK